MNNILRTENRRFAAAVIISLLIHLLLFVCCGRAPKPAQPEPVMNVKLVFAPKEKVFNTQPKPEVKKQEAKKQEITKASPAIEKAPAKPTEHAPVNNALHEISAETDAASDTTEVEPSAAAPEATAVPEKKAETSDEVKDITALTVLEKKAPDYPAFARKRREEGTVLVIVTVENGSVTKAETEKSSGFERLDASAIRAASHWKFDSTGKIRVRIPFVFRIK